MKVYILNKTEMDYLEILEVVTILGAYSSRAKAKAAAKELKLIDYSIVTKVLDE